MMQSSHHGALASVPAITEATSIVQPAFVRTLVSLPQKGIVLGASTAPVTLVEFADLQCPACRQYALSVFPQLLGLVRSGRLRIVWRDLAFIGPDSLRAARMAAAGTLQNRLWAFAAVFFYNEGAENSGYVTDRFLRSVASAVPGLGVARALAQRSSGVVRDQIHQAAHLARKYGVTGTPALLIGPTSGRLRPIAAASVLEPRALVAAIRSPLASGTVRAGGSSNQAGCRLPQGRVARPVRCAAHPIDPMTSIMRSLATFQAMDAGESR
jgi:protein-disulfide isomerase